MKMAPQLVRLYEQMPEPKYVIAMGLARLLAGCCVLRLEVDKLIPVDVYLPGCPPRPEAIIDAIIKLRKKIMSRCRSGIRLSKRIATTAPLTT